MKFSCPSPKNIIDTLRKGTTLIYVRKRKSKIPCPREEGEELEMEGEKMDFNTCIKHALIMAAFATFSAAAGMSVPSMIQKPLETIISLGRTFGVAFFGKLIIDLGINHHRKEE